jgi:hypothetical protein
MRRLSHDPSDGLSKRDYEAGPQAGDADRHEEDEVDPRQGPKHRSLFDDWCFRHAA